MVIYDTLDTFVIARQLIPHNYLGVKMTIDPQ